MSSLYMYIYDWKLFVTGTAEKPMLQKYSIKLRIAANLFQCRKSIMYYSSFYRISVGRARKKKL